MGPQKVQLPWDRIKYKFHGYFILSILYVLFSIILYTVLQVSFGRIYQDCDAKIENKYQILLYLQMFLGCVGIIWYTFSLDQAVMQENGEEEEEEEEDIIVEGRKTEESDLKSNSTIEDSMSSLYSSNRSGGHLHDS